MYHSDKDFHNPFRQGDLVTFTLPYANGKEECAIEQRGVVLSSSQHNTASDRLCICPVLCNQDSMNDIMGIPVCDTSTHPAYLRPDLSTCLGISYGKVSKTGESRLPMPHVNAAITKFLNMVQPTSEKLVEMGKGFLAYAQMGWFDDVPFLETWGSSAAPVLCITPPEIYEKTGLATIMRAYSHVEKFHPCYGVALSARGWFSEGFISSTNFCTLSVKRLSRRSGKKPFRLELSAAKAIHRKMEAVFLETAYEAVKTRYTTERGNMPSHVTSASMSARHSKHTPR